MRLDRLRPLLVLAPLVGLGCRSADGTGTGSTSATATAPVASASAAPEQTTSTATTKLPSVGGGGGENGAASASAVAGCEGLDCGREARTRCAPGVLDASGACVCPAGFRAVGAPGRATCERATVSTPMPTATATATGRATTTATATAKPAPSFTTKSTNDRCPPGSELCN